MAKIDYFPDDMDSQDTWFETYVNNLDAALTAVGIPVLDGAPVKTLIGTARTSLTKWKNTKAQGQSDSEKFRIDLKAATNGMRPFNEIIKNKKPPYTLSIGESIGIEGAVQTPDPTNAKPTGKLVFEGGGVTIKFKMNIAATSVHITSKRGDETAFSFVADDTNSPYNDFRANLKEGPEDRQFILQYKDSKGALIGMPSETLRITVPG